MPQGQVYGQMMLEDSEGKFNTGITGLNLAGAWIEYVLIGY